jgi:type II secretory pathway pseudopilin PulG
MNFPPQASRSGGSKTDRGFTMVEIAIALGVIAFALVAIIGILPFGLQVQQENREKTVIKQDAVYFMNAIRTGAREEDDLPAFVESIDVGGTVVSNFPSGYEIIGLLSRTNYLGANEPVSALVRAISGSAAGRSVQSGDLAFRYRMNVMIEPLPNPNPNHPNLAALWSRVWDIRMEFQWPILPGGQVGGNRAVYRGMVTGTVTNDPPGSPYLFFEP